MHSVNDSVLLVSTCVRTFDSLFYQYKECRYNEPSRYTLQYDDEGEINHYHKTILLKLEQRPVDLSSGVYVYYMCESLYIVFGTDTISDLATNKMKDVIRNYLSHTSSITPNIVLCSFTSFYGALQKCYSEITHAYPRILIDITLVGLMDNHCSLSCRLLTHIVLEEECGKIPEKGKHILKCNGQKVRVSSISFLEYVLTYIKRAVV